MSRQLSFPDDSPHSVDGLKETFLGSEFTGPDGRHWECDHCSKGVSYKGGFTAVTYLSDTALGSGDLVAKVNAVEKLVTMATYCTDHPRLLLFPCEGVTEAKFRADYDADAVCTDITMLDISPADDGIPWNPVELSESISGQPFDQVAGRSEFPMWGPENIVTLFLSAVGDAADIRDIVGWDGEPDPKALGRARRAWSEFLADYSAGGADRQSFRQHRRDQ